MLILKIYGVNILLNRKKIDDELFNQMINLMTEYLYTIPEALAELDVPPKQIEQILKTNKYKDIIIYANLKRNGSIKRKAKNIKDFMLIENNEMMNQYYEKIYSNDSKVSIVIKPV